MGTNSYFKEAQGAKAQGTFDCVDTQGDHRNLRKRSRKSARMDRAGRLDRTRGTAQVSSAKKVEVKRESVVYWY